LGLGTGFGDPSQVYNALGSAPVRVNNYDMLRITAITFQIGASLILVSRCRSTSGSAQRPRVG